MSSYNSSPLKQGALPSSNNGLECSIILPKYTENLLSGLNPSSELLEGILNDIKEAEIVRQLKLELTLPEKSLENTEKSLDLSKNNSLTSVNTEAISDDDSDLSRTKMSIISCSKVEVDSAELPSREKVDACALGKSSTDETMEKMEIEHSEWKQNKNENTKGEASGEARTRRETPMEKTKVAPLNLSSAS